MLVAVMVVMPTETVACSQLLTVKAPSFAPVPQVKWMYLHPVAVWLIALESVRDVLEALEATMRKFPLTRMASPAAMGSNEPAVAAVKVVLDPEVETVLRP